MTGTVCALGVDPGPVPGYFLALWRPGVKEAVLARAWQCPAAEAPELLADILDVHEDIITCGQIEEFRTGYGPGSKGKYASVTRAMIPELTALAAEYGVKLAVRHSSQVMRWASNDRLKKAGLYAASRGKKDARAASRHALWCAVHDGGLPDPLSRKVMA